MLAGGTLLAGLGFALLGLGHGAALAFVALALMGLGGGVQHPLGSELIAAQHGAATRRSALSRYNVAGDIGKVIFPALMALMLTAMHWRMAVLLLAGIGALAALVILLALPGRLAASARATAPTAGGPWHDRTGCTILTLIGVLDGITRVGCLTLLPFVLIGKGAAAADTGFALSALFVGGALGKLACGWLAQRFGATTTVIVTETATALAIMALPLLPLGVCLMLLPLLGIALNGTSSALYGTVPELAGESQRQKAFALFYTATIGAGAVAPFIYGFLGDKAGIGPAMTVTGAAVLVAVPLALWLRRHADLR